MHEIETQCDQDFSMAANLVQSTYIEFVVFRDEQEVNSMLKKLMALIVVQLRRRNFEISTQGNLVEVEDDGR